MVQSMRLFPAVIAGVLLCGGAHAQLARTLDCARILPKSATGYFAYYNPATGQLTSAPVKGVPSLKLTPEDLYPFSTSHQGLTSKTLDSGLTVVDLEGRFQQGSIAVMDAAGAVHIIRIGGEIFQGEAGRCMAQAVARRHRLKDRQP